MPPSTSAIRRAIGPPLASNSPGLMVPSLRRDDEEADGGGHQSGIVQHFPKAFQRQRTARQADDHGSKASDRTSLDGREQSAIDAAQHECDQKSDRATLGE